MQEERPATQAPEGRGAPERLHDASRRVPIGDAVQSIQPFVHFSRKAAVEAALKTWTSARLERAMAELAEAALEARRQSAMAELIAQRALLALAIKARRKE